MQRLLAGPAKSPTWKKIYGENIKDDIDWLNGNPKAQMVNKALAEFNTGLDKVYERR